MPLFGPKKRERRGEQEEEEIDYQRGATVICLALRLLHALLVQSCLPPFHHRRPSHGHGHPHLRPSPSSSSLKKMKNEGDAAREGRLKRAQQVCLIEGWWEESILIHALPSPPLFSPTHFLLLSQSPTPTRPLKSLSGDQWTFTSSP